MTTTIPKGTKYFHAAPDTYSGVSKGIVTAEKNLKVDARTTDKAFLYTSSLDELGELQDYFQDSSYKVTITGSAMFAVMIEGPLTVWGTNRSGFRYAKKF